MEPGFWLMIYVSAWAHVFGTYATEVECNEAAKQAIGHSCEVETSWWSRRPMPACGCVPQPSSKQAPQQQQQGHPHP